MSSRGNQRNQLYLREGDAAEGTQEVGASPEGIVSAEEAQRFIVGYIYNNRELSINPEHLHLFPMRGRSDQLRFHQDNATYAAREKQHTLHGAGSGGKRATPVLSVEEHRALKRPRSYAQLKEAQEVPKDEEEQGESAYRADQLSLGHGGHQCSRCDASIRSCKWCGKYDERF